VDTVHECDRQTDRQNYDLKDRERIASHGKTRCLKPTPWQSMLRRPITAALYLVLFEVIHQLPLMRDEYFWLSKFTLHSDLRRRAASRRALPRTSSLIYILKLPSWPGLYMALSVSTKMDNVLVLTATVRVWRKVFPPLPRTTRVYRDSDSTGGIFKYTPKHSF